MIRYLYATELAAFPTLTDTMFSDRATQFRDRLKWMSASMKKVGKPTNTTQ